MALNLTEEQRSRLHIVRADISRLKTDAVVNAANADFSPAGSVDKIIHERAGTALRTAGRQFVAEYGRCFAGGAEIMPGFNLPARYVIQAVGPVWCGGSDGESALLARAYARCMETARIRDLAFNHDSHLLSVCIIFIFRWFDTASPNLAPGKRPLTAPSSPGTAVRSAGRRLRWRRGHAGCG